MKLTMKDLAWMSESDARRVLEVLYGRPRSLANVDVVKEIVDSLPF